MIARTLAHAAGVTGIAWLDKFLSPAAHPASTQQKIAAILPEKFSRSTAIADSWKLASLLRAAEMDSVLSPAREKFDSEVAAVESLLDGFPAKVEADTSRAKQDFWSAPSEKSLRALIHAKATAEGFAEIESDLAAEIPEWESWLSNQPDSLANGLKALLGACRRSDLAVAVNIGLRVQALLENGLDAAKVRTLAAGLLLGKTAEGLPPEMIPAAWFKNLVPTGFRWDGEALDFA
jgi:hypothetical protein